MITPQQRVFLTAILDHGPLTPDRFAGDPKPASRGTFYPTITRGSAAAVLRRLEARGLVDGRFNDRAYRLTNEGRRALGLRSMRDLP